MEDRFASLLALAGLGAFHGLNPGMGWLFAVALGMQEGRRGAVWRALIPLTLGHARVASVPTRLRGSMRRIAMRAFIRLGTQRFAARKPAPAL